MWSTDAEIAVLRAYPIDHQSNRYSKPRENSHKLALNLKGAFLAPLLTQSTMARPEGLSCPSGSRVLSKLLG